MKLTKLDFKRVCAAAGINHDSLMAKKFKSFLKVAIKELKLETAPHPLPPHIRLVPQIFPDGNRWCMLYGMSLQEGVAGFGKTPALAADDFDKNWEGQTLTSSHGRRGPEGRIGGTSEQRRQHHLEFPSPIEGM